MRRVDLASLILASFFSRSGAMLPIDVVKKDILLASHYSTSIKVERRGAARAGPIASVEIGLACRAERIIRRNITLSCIGERDITGITAQGTKEHDYIYGPYFK